jgi:hypothetical protein
METGATIVGAFVVLAFLRSFHSAGRLVVRPDRPHEDARAVT